MPNMPKKYCFHETVIKALEKENWVITQDPLHIQVNGIDFYIDLGAENLIAAKKAGCCCKNQKFFGYFIC